MSPRTKEANEKIQEQSRQQILMAALKCFGELGYAHTSVNRIANEAGISKGLIYHYFNSKEDLLKGIFYMMLEEGDQIMSNWETSQSAREKLRSTIEESFAFMKANTGVLRFLFSLSIQPEVAENLKEFFETEKKKRMQLFIKLFEELGYDDPETEAYYVGAVLDGIGFGYIGLQDDYPIEKMEQKLFKKYKL